MTDVMDTTRTEPPMPHLMRAAYVERFGPADTIRYGKLPMPPVGPDHVLVRIAGGAAPHPPRSTWNAMYERALCASRTH
jgi:hypothetical protein